MTVRHSRVAAFERARTSSTESVEGWSALVDDPNDPTAVAHRARTMAAAWRPDVADRITFIEQRARGRHVLDIGCVAHDPARMDSPEWLHGRIAAAAASCVGVDILEDGVAVVTSRGYDAVALDLTAGLGSLSERGPFDVIVAGELLEHVPDLDMVFRIAAEGLTPGGEMILTTPNPYSPRRVRAGQLGIIWENVDHVSYVFPSGVAELAERRGLVLAEAATVDDAPKQSSLVRRAKRTVRGSGWRNIGFATTTDSAQVAVDEGTIGKTLRRFARPERRFLGETFVYVIRRPSRP